MQLNDGVTAPPMLKSKLWHLRDDSERMLVLYCAREIIYAATIYSLGKRGAKASLRSDRLPSASPAPVDSATQEIISMAEEADPLGQRTLGASQNRIS